jgi:hypothetical protein
MDLNPMVPYFSHEQTPQIGDPSPPIFGQVPISSCLCHRLYPDSILTKFYLHFTLYSPQPSENAPLIHVNSHSICTVYITTPIV